MKILDDFTGGREQHTSGCADRLIKLFNEQNAVLPQADGSLPTYVQAGIEAKHYGDEMNKLSVKPNGFHEIDFYNGTVWLRKMIEGNGI